MFKLDLNPGEIDDLRKGGDKTYNKIFEEAYPELCDYINRMSNGENDGEDIAQDALIKFHKKRTDFDSAGEIMSYLYTICRNKYINLLKHNGVKRKYIQFLKNRPETTEPAYIETTTVVTLAAEIEKLPAKCQEIFKLLYFEQLSNQEVAERLNISESNVAHQKFTAIQRLRKSLTNKHTLLMVLLIAIFGLKFFLGSFSIYGGLLVQYYVKATNQRYH